MVSDYTSKNSYNLPLNDGFARISKTRVYTDAIVEHINQTRGYDPLRDVGDLRHYDTDELIEVLTEVAKQLISDWVYPIVERKSINRVVVCHSFMLYIGLPRELSKRELSVLKLRDYEQYQNLIQHFPH